MKTKEQEREALEQIKSILKDFGADTYLGMAFDGCIQDAEENIENDFGLSMKQRFESTVKQIAKLDDKIKELETNYEEAKRSYERLYERILPPDILNKIVTIAANHKDEMKEKAMEQAEIIVQLADNPKQKEFTEAVANHRRYTNAMQDDEEILDTIRKKMFG